MIGAALFFLVMALGTTDDHERLTWFVLALTFAILAGHSLHW